MTNIADAFFTVSLDRELLDESVMPRLNPLTIRVLSLTSMPDKPVSYDDLRDKCASFAYEFAYCILVENIVQSTDLCSFIRCSFCAYTARLIKVFSVL